MRPKTAIQPVMFLLLLLAAAAMAAGCRAKNADLAPGAVLVEYFYNNPCASCDEEGKFRDRFNALTGDDAKGVAVEFRCYNIFRESALKEYEAACARYGIKRDPPVTPCVVVGHVALLGQDQIDKGLAGAFRSAKEKAQEQSAK